MFEVVIYVPVIFHLTLAKNVLKNGSIMGFEVVVGVQITLSTISQTFT